MRDGTGRPGRVAEQAATETAAEAEQPERSSATEISETEDWQLDD